jgi:hypothetical protein
VIHWKGRNQGADTRNANEIFYRIKLGFNFQAMIRFNGERMNIMMRKLGAFQDSSML